MSLISSNIGGISTKIGFQYLRIFANFIRRTLKNFAAKIKHDDMLAKIADKIHVMFDDQ